MTRWLLDNRPAKEETTSPRIDALADAVATDAETATLSAELATGAAKSAQNAPQRAAANAEAARIERIRRELSAEETSWLARLMPRRSPWPELVEFDEKIAALDAAQAAASADIQRLEAEVRDAGDHDLAVLASWHAAGAEGKRGQRPEATVPGIHEQLEQRQADRDALAEAATAAIADKAVFVERNRKRLVQRADTLVAKDHARMLALIDELEQVRGDLLADRETALWARLYPNAEAAADVPRSLVLGLAQPMKAAIGQSVQLSADRIFELLRVDAGLISEAISREQKIAVHGADKTDARSAVWVQTDEGVARDRAEKREALERYRTEWGSYPA